MMNLIGQKISETRKMKGFTQEELAELSKVNLRTIQRIENYESEPRGKTLKLICDALNIDIEELLKVNYKKEKKIVSIIINGIFLLILNVVLMSIIGYLTYDSEANLNSRVGAVLLSFFIPFFIVYQTPKMSAVERLLKFGLGFMVYIALVIILHGFPSGFVTGLIPCLILSLGILYYGKYFILRST